MKITIPEKLKDYLTVNQYKSVRQCLKDLVSDFDGNGETPVDWAKTVVGKVCRDRNLSSEKIIFATPFELSYTYTGDRTLGDMGYECSANVNIYVTAYFKAYDVFGDSKGQNLYKVRFNYGTYCDVSEERLTGYELTEYGPGTVI